MAHEAEETRYSSMRYNRCGRSGLKLPAISLGLWHNFGGVDSSKTSRSMVLAAFDLGITHFDLVKVRALNQLALARGQTLAQLALAWVLRHPIMTSALIGASKVAQLEDAVGAVNNLSLSAEELQAIEGILQ